MLLAAFEGPFLLRCHQSAIFPSLVPATAGVGVWVWVGGWVGGWVGVGVGVTAPPHPHPHHSVPNSPSQILQADTQSCNPKQEFQQRAVKYPTLQQLPLRLEHATSATHIYMLLTTARVAYRWGGGALGFPPHHVCMHK